MRGRAWPTIVNMNRSPERCSPGMSATGGTCHGGRARGRCRPLSGVAVGGDAAADDGGGGRALFAAFLARWPMIEAWQRRRSTRSWRPGRGLAITPGRATSMPVPGSSSPSMAAGFRRASPELAQASGHRRLHRGSDCRDRLRCAGGGGRRQCRARGRAALRRRDAAARGEGRDRAVGETTLGHARRATSRRP